MNLLKGADYGLSPVLGIPAGIYLSAYVYFKKWPRAIRAINWLFKDEDHCKHAYERNLDDIKYYYGEPQ